MSKTTRVSRGVYTFGRENRSLFVAATLVVGFLFVMGMLFGGSSITNTRVQAQSAAEFQGGATAEMLAYALNFGAASDYAVFGGRSVHNHGNSNFRGRVGSTGQVVGVPGLTESNSPESLGQAKQDMKDALRWIAQLPCADVAETNLGGKTFTPGVYCLPSAELAGQMTLSGGGDANSRFLFRIAGGLSTSAESNIRLIDGARATNVYFVAGGDVTIGAESSIKANIISNNAISIGTGSTMEGKTFGLEGSVNIETSNLGAGTGSIEICKNLSPGDPIPVGTIFSFTVTGIAAPVQVAAGSCSNAIDVAAGNVTVTETARANTAVISIVTNPANRRVSFNLATRSVVVAVPEGDVTDETVVTFTNQTTRTGTIEICKRALGADVTGFFQFTVEGAPGQIFSVPVGGCSPAITVTTLQVPQTDFTINVTELARANYRLEEVTTFPANRLNTVVFNQGFDANGNGPFANPNGGYANVDVISGGNVNQQTTVNFYNRSLPGQIKVCKITADPALIPVGTLFRFTVSGLAPTSPTQTLPGVGVTRTVDVPAGPDSQGGFCEFVEGTFVVGTPVLVTETGLTPGQTLPGGLTFADVRVSRIRASTAFSPGGTIVQSAAGPVTGPTPNPNLLLRQAVFNARNTTAIVDFTNFIFRPSILKICKIAGPGVAVGTPFTFTVAAVNPLTSFPVPTAPVSVLAGSCEFAQGPFPADAMFPGIGTFNFNTQVIVTEGAAAGTSVTAVTSPTGGTVTPNLPGRAGTILLNQSLLPGNLFNEIAFTNAATVGPNPVPAPVRFDFDGDRVSDEVIYRPSTGTWWYSSSLAGGDARAIQWGNATDRLVAADYDGDGRTDFAIYRGNGEWHILGSNSPISVRTFGLAGDIPQPGDYDGDGKADLAVYRPSDSTWYLQQSTAGFSAVRFGISTDSPQAADYDGDRRMDIAVYRDGTWYILGSTAGFSAMQFGLAGDRPVPADYDGDGRADVAVYRVGIWHIMKSGSGYTSSQFGMAGDVPVPADYDGDGKTDMTVYRVSNNVWHVMRSGQAESGYSSMVFGTGGDMLLNY